MFDFAKILKKASRDRDSDHWGRQRNKVHNQIHGILKLRFECKCQMTHNAAAIFEESKFVDVLGKGKSLSLECVFIFVQLGHIL